MPISTPNQTRTLRACAALLVLAFLALPMTARAARGQSPATVAIESVRAFAPDAELVVFLDDAAGQRQSAPGAAMTRMLVDFGLGREGSELTRAWSGLAGRLGLGNAGAFDGLLGKRIVFVARGAESGFSDWALVSVAPRDLALDLIKKLDAKGRDTEAGQTIFAIEGGAYRLALVRIRGGSDESRVVVFAPKGSDELLRILVRGLAQREHWDHIAGEGRTPASSVMGVLSQGGADVARVHALLTAEGWQGIAHFELPEFEMRSAGWAGGEFQRLSEGAILALGDELDLALVADSPVAALLPIDPARLRELAAHCTGRVFARIRPEAGGGVEVAAAIEMDRTNEAGALADRAMRDLVGVVTANPDAVSDYMGFLPAAVRTTPLRGEFVSVALVPIVGPNPEVAWRLAPAGTSAWWTLRLAPGEPDPSLALDALAQGLPPGDAGGRIVSIGMASPGPIAGLFRGKEEGEQAGTFRAAFGRVESVRWSTRQKGTGLEVGFDVRMATSP